MLNGLLHSNGPDIFDAGACFVAMGTCLLGITWQWTTFLGLLLQVSAVMSQYYEAVFWKVCNFYLYGQLIEKIYIYKSCIVKAI